MATQPPSQKVQLGQSEFAGQPLDGNRNAVGAANWFQTADASTTPVLSPATVLTTAVTMLTVPTNARSIIIAPKTNNVQVSEVSGTGSLTQYIEVPAGTTLELDVSILNNVYLLGVAGSAVVSFAFVII